jgi:hypothetical protein
MLQGGDGTISVALISGVRMSQETAEKHSAHSDTSGVILPRHEGFDESVHGYINKPKMC